MPADVRAATEPSSSTLEVALNRSTVHGIGSIPGPVLRSMGLSGALRGRGRLRLAALIVGLAVLAGGCAAPRIGSATESHIGRVFCMRGLLDVFSLGLNDLAERLRSEGVAAISVSGPSWQALGREIHRAWLRGDLHGPLILIGHSHGADNAVRMARTLGKRNIDVELLVLLDATSPPGVPSNVARCLHLYRPTVLGHLFPFVFAGNPVEAEDGNTRTEIVNMIVSREIFGPLASRIDHFNIDASGPVHDLVVKEVLRICPPLRSARGVAVSRGASNGS